MENGWNLSQEQVDRLLKMAAGRLGVDPQTLRSQLERGSLESLGGPEGDRVREMLSNPEQLRGAMGREGPGGLLGTLLGPKGR